MISVEEFHSLVTELGQVAQSDIAWSENVQAPKNARVFAFEAIWIICNSGMRFEVARTIEGRVLKAIDEGRPINEVFGHKGKAGAMQHIWDNKAELFKEYKAAPDKLAFLETLPWVGPTTKFHLAKNFGLDYAKPDVHLMRLGEAWGKSPAEICKILAAQTGYRIGTVDLILWRACATGVMSSHTGRITKKSGNIEE